MQAVCSSDHGDFDDNMSRAKQSELDVQCGSSSINELTTSESNTKHAILLDTLHHAALHFLCRYPAEIERETAWNNVSHVDKPHDEC